MHRFANAAVILCMLKTPLAYTQENSECFSIYRAAPPMTAGKLVSGLSFDCDYDYKPLSFLQ